MDHSENALNWAASLPGEHLKEESALNGSHQNEGRNVQKQGYRSEGEAIFRLNPQVAPIYQDFSIKFRYQRPLSLRILLWVEKST